MDKRRIYHSVLLGLMPLYAYGSTATLYGQQQFNTLIEQKLTFVKQCDRLQLLPRITSVCTQLQEICRDSQEVCKARRFALDLELAILVQLYLKQLQPHELGQLKKIIKQIHETQEKTFMSQPAEGKRATRQTTYFELIFT
jgi:hypothetical protein